MKFKAVQGMMLGAALAGCAGDSPTDGGGPPDGFTFLGTWQLHVDAATNCWAEFDTRIAITQATLTTGSNGTLQLNNPAGWWYIAPPGPDHPSTLTGSLSPASGAFTLRLWRG